MQSDTTGSLQEFHKILEEAGKKGASDIHYVPKEQLLLRIDGRLVDMTEAVSYTHLRAHETG